MKITKAIIEKKLKKDIPITKHSQFSILKLSQEESVLSAKLKANINHKGTAFGGSQFSLCALAAYAYVYKWLNDKKIETDNIVIAEGSIRYRRPVARDFKVVARLSSEVLIQENERKITFPVICYVMDKNLECSEFLARFVVRY